MSAAIWAPFVCIVALVFGALEWVALTDDVPNNTLSRRLRRWVNVNPWVHGASGVAWVTFSVWFGWHIWLTSGGLP